MRDNYQNYKLALEAMSLPQACVDLDLLDQNIERLLLRAHGKKIRLATKSIRSRAIIEYILTKHPTAYSGLMCYHYQEALWWASLGHQDVLVAYPYIKLQIEAHDYELLSNIIFMVDHHEHVEALTLLASKSGKKIRICLDIDMSTQFGPIYFGVHRSSLKTLEDISSLLDKLKGSPLQVVAVMGYEAQLAGVADKNPFKKLLNFPIKLLKERAKTKVFDFRLKAVKLIEQYGYKLLFVNGGGTGSLEITALDSCVTELAAGSGYYAPLLFDYYSNFDLKPAAFFALELTRHPSEGIFTCAGGGYIASGAAGEDRLPRPSLPTDLKLDVNEGLGEVQTPLHTSLPLKLGDPIFFRHAKAGEFCEHFNHLVLIRQNRVCEVVKTYRGEGKCFL